MDYHDYYKTMGVSRDATQDEIKRAYRKLARKYHPDVTDDPEGEKRFKEVGEAYAVLKNPEKRAAYDQLGETWQAGQDFQPPPGWDDGFEFSGAGSKGHAGHTEFEDGAYSDFFESLFGQAQAPGGFRSGQDDFGQSQDSHAHVTIDLSDSYDGATRTISLGVPEVTADGHVTTRKRTLNVKIPRGIKSGQTIRLAGQGASRGGRAGDLYLEVEIRQDDRFRIDGSDIYMDLPVAPWEAALGARITVSVPSGDIELKVPENSTQGRRLRLKGKGIPGKQPGDFYAVLDVVLPPADSEGAKALYEKMSKEMAFDPRAGL
jgi:curved DNA-binding protein